MTRLPIRCNFRSNSSRSRLACLRLEDRLAPATITITTIADNTNLDGKVSLREALTSANNNANLNADVVAVGAYGTEDLVFDGTLFATPQSIKLLTALPNITGDVNFKGTSAANVTVTRDGTAPAIRLFNCAISGVGTVSFSNMTLTGGSATANGAGIFAADDALTITNCVIANNVTTTRGGGISFIAGGSVTVINSTISGNSAQGGGGIYCFSTGTLIIDNCTISGNTASQSLGGGGVLNMSSTVTIRNSTISGNHATGGTGGGITLQNVAASVTIQNSTIAFNDATTTGGGIQRTAGTLSIESVVVAKNTAVTDGADAFGTVNFAKFNLVGATDGSTGITDPSNKTGTKASPLDPLLGALGKNGGPAQTHLVLAGSPVIDNGSNSAGLTTDQRGAGFPRISGPVADVGAVERPSTLVTNTSVSGDGSLRQAITNANAIPGPDTVTFDPAFFTSAKAINQGSGEISITDAVAIIGPAAKLTINGNGTSRVFNTSKAAADKDITIESLTITQGNGAILVGDEDLTLTNCTITGNTSNAGGAIYVASAQSTLNLLGCTVSNNSVTGGGLPGGAILLYGASFVLIQDTTISGNTVAGNGGAVAFYNGGSLLMLNSIVSGNTASGTGGGLYFFGTVAAAGLKIVNSTISGNSAGLSSGGGIVLSNFSGTLTVQNSTITNNTANGGSGGGGIARPSGAGTISLESTIVSGNTNAAAPDIFSAGTVNMKASAIGSGTGFTATNLGGNLPFQPHTNLLLGSLTNNGGPTLTHALLAGSPAINAGNNVAGLANDQRGAGFARVIGSATDIGAFESQPPSLVVINVNDSGPGSLRQAIIDANAQPGADTVTFDPAIFTSASTITLATVIAIDEAVTITGPTAKVTISGGGVASIFNTTGAGIQAAIVLQGLALTNGLANGTGGAILVDDEALTIQNCSITNSTAQFADGGAIGVLSEVGSLLIEDCTLTGNSAVNSVGGAIGSTHTVTIRRSTISGNTARGGGAISIRSGGSLIIEDSTLSGNKATVQDGGAIELSGSTSATVRRSTLSANTAALSGGAIAFRQNGEATNRSLVIEDCTLSANTCNTGFGVSGGGAIFFPGTATTFLISNSTLSGNAAPSSVGGALALANFNGAVVVQNSTITGNSASNSGAGGVHVTAFSATVSLSSTIVAGNTSVNFPDLYFNLVNIGGNNNLIGVVEPGTATMTGTGNQTGTKAAPLNAKLGSLASNGGPTLTHALVAGSPAINAGNNPAALANDQRGAGFVRSSNGSVDIGAFEVQVVTPPPCIPSKTVIINGGAVQRSRVTEVKIDFNQIVTFSGTAVTAFELKRQGDNATVGLTASVSNDTATHVTLTFTGALSQFTSLEDGRYTLTVLASKVSNANGNLDGDCNGTGGDNFQLIGSPANGLFRFFGDITGDGAVAANDFIQFRLALGGNNPTFDFDGDGAVAASDFIQFRLRFGGSI